MDFANAWIEVDRVRLALLAAALLALGVFLERRRPKTRADEADPLA